MSEATMNKETGAAMTSKQKVKQIHPEADCFNCGGWLIHTTPDSRTSLTPYAHRTATAAWEYAASNLESSHVA